MRDYGSLRAGSRANDEQEPLASPGGAGGAGGSITGEELLASWRNRVEDFDSDMFDMTALESDQTIHGATDAHMAHGAVETMDLDSESAAVEGRGGGEEMQLDTFGESTSGGTTRTRRGICDLDSADPEDTPPTHAIEDGAVHGGASVGSASHGEVEPEEQGLGGGMDVDTEETMPVEPFEDGAVATSIVDESASRSDVHSDHGLTPMDEVARAHATAPLQVSQSQSQSQSQEGNGNEEETQEQEQGQEELMSQTQEQEEAAAEMGVEEGSQMMDMLTQGREEMSKDDAVVFARNFLEDLGEGVLHETFKSIFKRMRAEAPGSISEYKKLIKGIAKDVAGDYMTSQLSQSQHMGDSAGEGEEEADQGDDQRGPEEGDEEDVLGEEDDEGEEPADNDSDASVSGDESEFDELDEDFFDELKGKRKRKGKGKGGKAKGKGKAEAKASKRSGGSRARAHGKENGAHLDAKAKVVQEELEEVLIDQKVAERQRALAKIINVDADEHKMKTDSRKQSLLERIRSRQKPLKDSFFAKAQQQLQNLADSPDSAAADINEPSPLAVNFVQQPSSVMSPISKMPGWMRQKRMGQDTGRSKGQRSGNARSMRNTLKKSLKKQVVISAGERFTRDSTVRTELEGASRESYIKSLKMKELQLKLQRKKEYEIEEKRTEDLMRRRAELQARSQEEADEDDDLFENEGEHEVPSPSPPVTPLATNTADEGAADDMGGEKELQHHTQTQERQVDEERAESHGEDWDSEAGAMAMESSDQNALPPPEQDQERDQSTASPESMDQDAGYDLSPTMLESELVGMGDSEELATRASPSLSPECDPHSPATQHSDDERSSTGPGEATLHPQASPLAETQDTQELASHPASLDAASPVFSNEEETSTATTEGVEITTARSTAPLSASQSPISTSSATAHHAAATDSATHRPEEPTFVHRPKHHIGEGGELIKATAQRTIGSFFAIPKAKAPVPRPTSTEDESAVGTDAAVASAEFEATQEYSSVETDAVMDEDEKDAADSAVPGQTMEGAEDATPEPASAPEDNEKEEQMREAERVDEEQEMAPVDRNAAYRRMLEKDQRAERKARKVRGMGLVDDEAEEEEEEGAIVGLGDFGFTMEGASQKKDDEEKYDDTIREDDLEAVVDNLSDNEGDEEEGAAVRMRLERERDERALRKFKEQAAEGFNNRRANQSLARGAFDINDLVADTTKHTAKGGDGGGGGNENGDTGGDEEEDEIQQLDRIMRERHQGVRLDDSELPVSESESEAEDEAETGPAENSDEEDEKEDERRAKRFAKRAKMNIFLAKGAVDDTNSASRFFDDEESQSMLGLFKACKSGSKGAPAPRAQLLRQSSFEAEGSMQGFPPLARSSSAAASLGSGLKRSTSSTLQRTSSFFSTLQRATTKAGGRQKAVSTQRFVFQGLGDEASSSNTAAIWSEHVKRNQAQGESTAAGGPRVEASHGTKRKEASSSSTLGSILLAGVAAKKFKKYKRATLN